MLENAKKSEAVFSSEIFSPRLKMWPLKSPTLSWKVYGASIYWFPVIGSLFNSIN